MKQKLLVLFIVLIALFVNVGINSNDVSAAAKKDYKLVNNKGKVTKIVKYKSDGTYLAVSTYSYYSNGKKKRVVYYRGFVKNVYTQRNTYVYRSTGKKYSTEKVARYSNGNRKLTYKYSYNKKGQLKSNKYGTSKRVVYNYYSNNKISKRTTHTYSYKGKLTNKKVKYYKSNKPVPKKKTPREEVGAVPGSWWLDNHWLCTNLNNTFDENGNFVSSMNIDCGYIGEKSDYYNLPAIPEEYYTNPPVKPLQ